MVNSEKDMYVNINKALESRALGDDYDSEDDDSQVGDPYYIFYQTKINAGHPKKCMFLRFVNDEDAYDFYAEIKPYFANNCRLSVSKPIVWYNEPAIELPAGTSPSDEVAIHWRLVFGENDQIKDVYHVWMYHLKPDVLRNPGQLDTLRDALTSFPVSVEGYFCMSAEVQEIVNIKV